MDVGSGQVILEEAYDETYEPTENEILDYCLILGLNSDTEKDLMYIAKEGTKAPLPRDWKPVEDTKTGSIYYFNFRTNESTWDHPCDEFYRKLLHEERKRSREGGTTASKKGSKKPAKVKKTAGSAYLVTTPVPNPLNSVGGLVDGKGPLAPLGPIRGLPPLKGPPLKPGALTPVRPPTGVAPVMGPPPPPQGPPLTPTQAPLTSPHPHHTSGTPNTLNPLQKGGREGQGRPQGGGRDSQDGGREGLVRRFKEEGGGRGGVGGRREGGEGGLKGVRGNKGRDLLGTVELGTNLNISTQFEEEEEESSSAISGGFQSKFGKNLLNSKDLGLKSEEELYSSEEDNVTEELNRLLHSEGGESEAEEGEMERPQARLGQQQHTGYSLTGPAGIPSSPVLSPPIPSSLSPIPSTHHGGTSGRPNAVKWSQPAATITDTPAHATQHNPEPVITANNSRSLPITSPSITAPPSMKVGTSTDVTSGQSKPLRTSVTAKDTHKSVSQANVLSSMVPTTAAAPGSGDGFSVAEIKLGGQGHEGVVSGAKNVNNSLSLLEEMKTPVVDSTQELERLKLDHTKAVEELQKQLSAELEREREVVKREGREGVESVRREARDEVERVRREVEEERAEEEWKLRDRKLRNMSELKKMLKDEEEEEEARLVEEKENALRCLRQKMSAEKEKEERSLREEAERSRQELVQQLEKEKREEEARLHSEASQELREFREEAEREAEAGREEVKRELQRQLQVFREEQENRHNKEKAEIEESRREQLEALQREEQLKVQSELEKKQSVEEEREKAVQAHKEETSALEQELAIALEAKRSELQEQHRTALETVKKELEATLIAVKAEEERKVEMERQRLETEYDTISATMKEEQEGRVQQLKTELATAEEQYREQVQSQSERLASLQSDYDKRRLELEQLQHDLEQQSLQVENERRRVTEEEAKVKIAMEQEREALTSLQTSHVSLERDLEQLREQCAQQQTKLQELRGETEREGKGGRGRGRGRGEHGGGDSRGRGRGERGERQVGESGGRGDANRQDTDNPLLSVVTETTCTATCTSDHSPSPPPSTPPSPPPSSPPSPPVAVIQKHEQLPSTHAESVSRSGNKRVNAHTQEGRERVKTKSHDHKSEEDWSETSVGSMQFEELAPPTSAGDPPVLVEKTGDGLESVRTMLERNQRTLLQVLAEEQSALSSTKTLLRRRAKERRRGGEGREERDRNRDEGRGKQKKVEEKERAKFKTNTVQSKLQQEARALGELEKKLRSSRQLLSSKEHELRELHALLTEEDQSEGVEGSRIPQRGDETAQRANRMTATACAGKVGLSDQKGRDLMTHTCKRSSKTGSTVRTPRASRTDEETGTRTRKSSSRTRQTSLSASRSASSTHSRNGRREIVRTQAGRMSKRAPNDVSGEPLRVLRLEISEGSSGVEGSESSGVAQSGSTTPTASDDVSTIEEEEMERQSEIAKSLKSINRRLSQLMSQTSQGPPLRSGPSTPPADESSHYVYSSAQPYPTSHSDTRWADPVLHVPHVPVKYQPQRRRRDFKSPQHVLTAPSLHNSFRHGVSSDGHVTTSPTYLYPQPRDRSSKEMIQQQTDWLQEFHRRFPSRPLPSPAPPARPPSVPLSPYSIPHAQLVMDSDKNIHLVHM